DCLVAILGCGKNRLKKALSGAPDCRYGKKDRGRQHGSSSVEAFFHVQYHQIGEALPDRFIKRGQDRIRDLDSDSEPDQDGAFNSEDEDNELKAWLDKPSSGLVFNTVVNKEHLVRRYLPPGNLAELFEHYQALQSLLGARSVSYSTFIRCYNESWKDVLRFREKSMFTQCEVCQTLKAQLHSSIGLELKLGALKAHRTHLEDTFKDRSQLWQLQSLSEDGHSSSVLTIVLDGMDQSKFAVPRDPALRAAASLCPSCLDSSSCPCQTIQFAQCYYFYVVVRLRPLMHTEGQHREAAHEVAWRLGVRLDPGSSCGRRTRQKGLSLCHRDNSLGAGESYWDATCAHTL
ncbi:unnamed protein product, partial [Effrenium voratum]